MTWRPRSSEPLQVCLGRTHANPEHIATLAAQNSSHQASAMPGASDDLLDRDAILGQHENRCIGVFPAEISLILEALGGGEQFWIDGHGADRPPDLAHGLAYRIEKGATGVIHQVTAIRDLNGARRSIGRGT